jgi:hypothetical protein
MAHQSESRAVPSPGAGSRRPLARVLISGLLGAVVGYGLAVGFVAEEAAPISKPLPAGEEAGTGRNLEAELEYEGRLRRALSKQVDELRAALEKAELAQLEAEHALAILHEPEAPKPLFELEPGQRIASLDGELEGAKKQELPWFDRDALVDACGSTSVVADIEQRWEQFEMDKLYLGDAARRDGYFRKPRYRMKLAKLERDLRADYGSEAYDAFLYAQGKPNRVTIDHVIANSPAGDAGLQKGDVVIRYDGERVFHPQEFKQATNRGELGDLVLLDVTREGEAVTLRLPRGPMGIRMKSRGDPPLSCH